MCDCWYTSISKIHALVTLGYCAKSTCVIMDHGAASSRRGHGQLVCETIVVQLLNITQRESNVKEICLFLCHLCSEETEDRM